MSGERTRVAAGLLAAAGMVAAAVASFVLTTSNDSNDAPVPTGIKPAHDPELELLAWAYLQAPERDEPPPTVVAVGRPLVEPDYDRQTIRRFIRHHLDRIDHCYTTKPESGGEIMTQFLITRTGAVTTSNATGFDPTIATCVAGVIATIKFPKPADGLAVLVLVPFSLRAPHRTVDDEIAAQAAAYMAGGRAYRPTSVYRQ